MARFRHITASAAAVFLACGNPALAADGSDEVEKIGIAAALGFTAADGKTTLGAGAGAIEAALLGSEAINQAGAIIVALARKGGASKDVLLLTRSETINAAAYSAIQKRLAAVKAYVSGVPQCSATLTPKDLKEILEELEDDSNGNYSKKLKLFAKTLDGKAIKPSVGDIIPALATSTSFTAIPVTVEDRVMLAAILVNRRAALPDQTVQQESEGVFAPAVWTEVSNWGAPGTGLLLKLPAEIQGDSSESEILRNYNDMLVAADALRHCADDNKAKAAVAAADAYASALNAVTDKAPVAPLSLAIQQESLYKSGAPKILRIAVEQSGGTSRTRSGIIYTLGIPGAAVVSAGLVVSFRLIDTKDGTTNASGIVRCGIRPEKMGSIERFARASQPAGEITSPRRKTTCSYIVG